MASSEFDAIPNGYPKLAALQGKEPEYIVLRKFRSLNAKNLLYLQSDIIELEQQLDQVDKELAASNCKDDLRSCPSFMADHRRRNLVLEIRTLLRDYNTAILQCKDLGNIPSPTLRHVTGLKKWMKWTDPIVDSSMDFLERRDGRGELAHGVMPAADHNELLSLNRAADSWFGNYLRHSWLEYFFIRDMVYSPDRKEAFIFFKTSTIDTIITYTAVSFSVILTIVAIVVLQYTTARAESLRLGLMGLFTALIAVVLALAGAKKSEVFIGTIGYVAVLVVFVSGENARSS